MSPFFVWVTRETERWQGQIENGIRKQDTLGSFLPFSFWDGRNEQLSIDLPTLERQLITHATTTASLRKKKKKKQKPKSQKDLDCVLTPQSCGGGGVDCNRHARREREREEKKRQVKNYTTGKIKRDEMMKSVRVLMLFCN